MATQGIKGLYIETTSYGATAAFWASLGFEASFETDHGSGQWQHPAGGPYVFINERPGGDLEVRPVLEVQEAAAFAPKRPVTFDQPFAPQHWQVAEAVIVDPDGRRINLEAPLSEGTVTPDADAHHQAVYGTTN